MSQAAVKARIHATLALHVEGVERSLCEVLRDLADAPTAEAIAAALDQVSQLDILLSRYALARHSCERLDPSLFPEEA